MSLPAPNKTVKRLLIRGPNWVGDAVMCEPALAAVRRLFPSADITLLVKPTIGELFNGHPGVDDVLIYQDPGPHAGVLGKLSLFQTLRQHRFDMAILFQNAFEAALLAFLARIPRRYGYATDGRRLLLTEAIPVRKRSELPHQVDYYVQLLSALGAEQKVAPPRLYISDEEEQAMALRFTEWGIGADDVLIGLNPGSTYGGAKRWLPERFAEAADRLAREVRAQVGRQVQIVIVGAKGEEPVGEAIAEQMETKPVRLAGRTNLRELMAVIKRCRLFLTNDTGPMHIAAAFGVPLVAVFGPTDWRRTSPFGCEDGIVRQPVECAPCLLRECPIDHRCMTGVTVDHVHETAMRQLRALSAKGGSRDAETTKTHASLSIPRSPLQGVPIFLDRDGTLNRDTGYVKAPEELEVFPEAAEAIASLNKAGAVVILTTNQSGIGRGMFSVRDLERVHARLREVLGSAGATLDAIYYCPHHPDEGCACRKPGGGMIDRAAEELGVSPSRGYLIGDQTRDIELARKVGARGILVKTGPNSFEAEETLRARGHMPDHVAAGLGEAVEWIMQDARVRYPLSVNR